jgi:hypothetical protein
LGHEKLTGILLTKKLKYYFTFLDAGAAELSHGSGMKGMTSSANIRPEIPEPLPNVTVAVGREASLPCVVRNLKDYKVF